MVDGHVQLACSNTARQIPGIPLQLFHHMERQAVEPLCSVQTYGLGVFTQNEAESP